MSYSSPFLISRFPNSRHIGPIVHINMYLRHVVITTQAADGISYILPNPSLLAFIVISPYHPSVAGCNDKTTTSIIQWEKPTGKLVNNRGVLSPGTYDRSGHVVRLASLLALLYINPPTLQSPHSLTHSLLQQTNVYNHKLCTFCQIKTANIYCERPIFTDLLSTNSITLSVRSPSVFVPLLRSLILLSLSVRTAELALVLWE